jgi:plastocyanin
MTRRTLLSSSLALAFGLPSFTQTAMAAPLPSLTSPGTRKPAPIIEIADDRHVPNEVRVPVGATVTWINCGSAWVGFAALDGSFDSGRIEPGETFRHTFSRSGSFIYVCEHHPLRDMTGRITVR